MANGFRFGVHLWTLPTGEWRETVERYESWGYSTVTVTDHLVVPQWDPFVMLSAVAAVSERLRVGTLVADVSLRTPTTLAKAAATIQLISGGRFELGLGAGYVADDFAAAGVPFESADRRIRRLEESIEVLRREWSEESTTFEGEVLRVTDVPRTLDAPVSVPILVGGGGPKVLAVAAKHADIVSIFPSLGNGDWSVAGALPDSTDAQIDAKSRVVDEAAEAVGRDPEGIEKNTLVVHTAVDDDIAPVRAQLAAADRVPVESIQDSSLYLTGSSAELQDRLLERRERCGISYYSLYDPGDEQLERFANQVMGPLTAG